MALEVCCLVIAKVFPSMLVLLSSNNGRKTYFGTLDFLIDVSNYDKPVYELVGVN